MDSTGQSALGELSMAHSSLHFGTLDDQNLERHCPLDHGRHDIESNTTLGDLEMLPLEIVFIVFGRLDVHSLFVCCRVNKRAMAVINSMTEYRDLVQVVPNVLRGVLSIETTPLMTCKDLHDALLTRTCQEARLVFVPKDRRCKAFAPFICLATCRRLCNACLIAGSHSYPSPFLPEEAFDRFGLQAKDLVDVPCFKSLPGSYSDLDILYTERFHLLGRGRNVWDAAVHLHGSEKAAWQFKGDKVMAAQRSGELPTKSGGPKSQYCWHPNGWPLRASSSQALGRNYMSLVSVPWINADKSIEAAIYCQKCFDFFLKGRLSKARGFFWSVRTAGAHSRKPHGTRRQSMWGSN